MCYTKINEACTLIPCPTQIISFSPSSKFCYLQKCFSIWTVTNTLEQACGHQGFDDYMELCQDSVADLVETLRLNGLTVSMKPRFRMSTSRNILEVNLARKEVSIDIDRLRITLLNLWRCSLSNLVNILGGRYFSVGSVRSDSHSKSVRSHWLPPIGDEPNVTTLASSTGTGGSPSAHPSANVSATANDSSQHQGIAPNAVSNKTPRTSKQPQAAFVHTSPTVINIPSANDFILLCFRVQKYLTYRHDLGVSNIRRDMVLFKAFRDMYYSRFRWAHCHFSLRTVQHMKFVKVNLVLELRLLVLIHNFSSSFGHDMKWTV
jgi:hypothetical protein